jgi:hypothetical protein
VEDASSTYLRNLVLPNMDSAGSVLLRSVGMHMSGRNMATKGMILISVRLSVNQSANTWNSVLEETIIWKWYGALPLVNTHVSH